MPPPAARPTASLRSYRRLRTAAVALLLAEVVIGVGGTLAPGKEIFPFASWFLFLTVPSRTTDYDLILRAQNDQAIDPPQSYSHLENIVPSAHSIVTYQLVQQLGEAQRRQDARLVGSIRRQIELQFRLPRVQYDLVRDTYEPIARWQTGAVGTRQTLRSFTAGEP